MFLCSYLLIANLYTVCSLKSADQFKLQCYTTWNNSRSSMIETKSYRMVFLRISVNGIKLYIVWLSLIWDTDWLNTVTWSTNISVCCPPQSCGGGTLIDTTHHFHANKWQTELAILSLQTCMLTVLAAHWLFIARTVQWIRVALRRTVQWIRIALRTT